MEQKGWGHKENPCSCSMGLHGNSPSSCHCPPCPAQRRWGAGPPLSHRSSSRGGMGWRAHHLWPIAVAGVTSSWALRAAPLTGFWLGFWLFRILVHCPCEQEAIVCLQSPVKGGLEAPPFQKWAPFFCLLLNLKGRQTLLGN